MGRELGLRRVRGSSLVHFKGRLEGPCVQGRVGGAGPGHWVPVLLSGGCTGVVGKEEAELGLSGVSTLAPPAVKTQASPGHPKG